MKYSFYLRKDRLDRSGTSKIRLIISRAEDGFKCFKHIPKVKSDIKYWDIHKRRIRPPHKDDAHNYHVQFVNPC